MTRFIKCVLVLVMSGLAASAADSTNRFEAVEKKSVLYLVVLLANDDARLPSLNKVRPAIKLAADRIAETQLLPGYSLQLSFRDSSCSSVHAPYAAVEAYKINQVHVFFGPSCEFALGKIYFHLASLYVRKREVIRLVRRNAATCSLDTCVAPYAQILRLIAKFSWHLTFFFVAGVD